MPVMGFRGQDLGRDAAVGGKGWGPGGYFFLKSPLFQALTNSFQAKGLRIFMGGIWPAE